MRSGARQKFAVLRERRTRAATGFLLLFVLIALLGLSRLQAQVQNDGTVTGRVTDVKGAVIPGATVTLTEQDNGHVVTVTSGDTGEFVANDVPVATYTLQVSAPNFANYIVQQLDVHAGENVTVNASLKPGATSSSVTVVAGSTGIDTYSATVKTTIDNTLVNNLPVDGNNVVTMAALLPGVTDVNAPTTFTRNTAGPTYNISGSRNNQNLMLLDGSIWNNLYNNSGLNFPPSQDLQEVSVILNNYSADYGRNVGSVFNVLTKGGSDKNHGSVWEYAQNSVFNAADYISKENPPLTMNQFGGEMGGPIPHTKLYYFGSFQDLIMNATAVAQAQTMTLAERGLEPDGVTPLPCVTAGYGSQPCANFSGDSITTWPNPIDDPVYGSLFTTTLNDAYAQATGGSPSATSPCVALLQAQPKTLANPEIPQVCWNPVAAALAKLTPIPTVSIGTATPYAVSSAPQPRNDRSLFLRTDWPQGRHTISARYYQTWANDHTANGISNGQGIATYDVNVNLASIHFGNISDTWVLTPSLVNVARAGYKRYNYSIAPEDQDTLASFGADFTQPNNSLPAIVIDNRVGYNQGSAVNTQHSVDEGIQLDDMLSWVHGKHNLQVGAEFLRLQYLQKNDEAPKFVFNNIGTATPAPIMSYVLGAIYEMTVGNESNLGAVQHDLYTYAQDSWRILPRLTLNLGLRWELPFNWYEPDGQDATFIPGYRSTVFPTAPANMAFVGDPGVPRSLIGNSLRDFAPRVGFAYDLNGNSTWVMRGAFGVFYDAINAQEVGVSSPFHYTANYDYSLGGLSIPLEGLPAVPQDYVKGQPAEFPAPYSITFPDRNFRTPYTQAVNFGFQHKFKISSTLEANYVGRFGRHLALGYDENPAIYDCSGAYFQLNPSVYCTSATQTAASYVARVKYPGFNYGGSGALDYMTEGFSDYNAGQVIYIERSREWLTATASYTFSKSIDDSSNTNITNTTDQPSLAIHRAVSDFNATQIFNLGYVLRYPSVTKGDRLLRAVINDWGLAGMYSVRTGHPFSVNLAGDSSLRDEKPQYAEIVSGGYAPLLPHRHRFDEVAEWFNTAEFSSPTNGTYGDAPRNFLNGPAYISNNMSLMRTFQISQERGTSLAIHISAFNVFNTPNLGQPASTYAPTATKNDNFGLILSTVGANNDFGTNGRRLQFDATLRF